MVGRARVRRPGAIDRYIVTAANSEKDAGHVIKIANGLRATLEIARWGVRYFEL